MLICHAVDGGRDSHQGHRFRSESRRTDTNVKGFFLWRWFLLYFSLTVGPVNIAFVYSVWVRVFCHMEKSQMNKWKCWQCGLTAYFVMIIDLQKHLHDNWHVSCVLKWSSLTQEHLEQLWVFQCSEYEHWPKLTQVWVKSDLALVNCLMTRGHALGASVIIRWNTCTLLNNIYSFVLLAVSLMVSCSKTIKSDSSHTKCFLCKCFIKTSFKSE